MSRKDSVAARERRLKRVAARYGVHVMKPLKPEPRVVRHGGYMLKLAETGEILVGERPYLFSASLEEAEAWLEANTAGGAGEE
jgi:hypothetical protein